MINFSNNIPPVSPPGAAGATSRIEGARPQQPTSNFSDKMQEMGKAVTKVDDHQQASDASIKDLLTGQNNDITAVVSDVAKADMSFKLLVGVRNKLIEAYKQTMNMQL